MGGIMLDEKETEAEFYEEFYKTLERSTLKLLKPKMFFTLTGGWDTRVIGGILARNKVRIPAVTFGSPVEITVAGKVAKVLGMQHYGYKCGIQEGLNILVKLKQLGYKYFLAGSLFDEINGSWMGSKARNYEQFRYAQEYALKQALPMISRIKESNSYPEPITPILDPEVIDCLDRMPWQLRVGKKIQRWILKNKFPELWQIPYYDSLLPSFMPYLMHGFATNIHLHIIKWP